MIGLDLWIRLKSCTWIFPRRLSVFHIVVSCLSFSTCARMHCSRRQGFPVQYVLPSESGRCLSIWECPYDHWYSAGICPRSHSLTVIYVCLNFLDRHVLFLHTTFIECEDLTGSFAGHWELMSRIVVSTEHHPIPKSNQRSFGGYNWKIWRTIYCSYMRLLLKYAGPVWCLLSGAANSS